MRTRDPAKLFRWLSEDVWPVWLDHGIDWRRRGFHEFLDPATLKCNADYRRLRVVTRQTYVFTEAALFGVARAQDAVKLGIDFLRAAVQPDGGYPRCFDLNGRPIDQTRDLYDHAFVLFAFASAARLFGREAVVDDARSAVRYISERLRHPELGFLEALPATSPRRQNPHMHLLEAVLAAFDAFGDPLYFDLGRELVGLFLGHFFRTEDGALAEFFDEDISPLRNKGCFIVEPGHHYEWVYLLDRFASIAAAAGQQIEPAIETASRALLAFVEHHAVSDPLNLVVDEVDSAGGQKRATFRLWPQMERIKCEARRFVDRNEPNSAATALFHMIEGAPRGLWHERLSADGRPMPGMVPASSLYHLTSALMDARATQTTSDGA